MKSKAWHPLLALCAGCAMVAQVRGELITYEQFIYPTGVTSIDGLNGGAGWGGPWSGNHAIDPTVGLETLFNQSPLPAGQATPTVPGPAGGYMYDPCEHQGGPAYGLVSIRPLGQPIDMAQDGAYYFSFLFRRNTVARDCSGLHTAFNNMRCVVAFLSGGNQPVNDAQIMFGSDIGFLGGSNSLEVEIAGPAEPGSVPADDGITNETTYLIVGKIVTSQTGYDQVFFERYKPGSSVDPVEPIWDKFSRPTRNSTRIDRICVYGEAPEAVDEIRIGTTYVSVTTELPPPPQAVPAVSSWGLPVAALLLLGCGTIANRVRDHARVQPPRHE